MSWQGWAQELRQDPERAVGDLLRGAADIGPFERAAPHEFLLAILPRGSRILSRPLLGEPPAAETAHESTADLPEHLDAGLSAWLRTRRGSPKPQARKLGAYAAQICEALQWPLYFPLPRTRAALQDERTLWLQWLGSLNLSAYRDPEHDYWQVLAAHQTDDRLHVHWQGFVNEAGRTRSGRYLDLGLLALARLPLSEEDSLRNLRLQVQALVNRYQHRKAWGTPAQEDLAEHLRGVMARNPSLGAANYRVFLRDLLTPLGEDRTASILSLLGLGDRRGGGYRSATVPVDAYRLEPPALAKEADEAVRAVRRSRSLGQAWDAIRPLLVAHEDFVHRTGDGYFFVRTLDRCARALCERYTIPDGEIQGRLFEWIRLALHMDGDDPRLWMLWELALRKAGYPQRAQWVLWEMTRRFPDHLPCRVELARLLAESEDPHEQAQARRLLGQVLRLDPEHLHAHSTLAQLAIRDGDWPQALSHARRGLQIDPGDGHSAVLLANAYVRRGEPGDLETAIEHLQRFTGRYRGNVKAEDYLRDLQRRQPTAAQAPIAGRADPAQRSVADAIASEVDPAWRAFAQSVRAWKDEQASGASLGDDPASLDRVLPLPEALRQALARRQWDGDVLDRYDEAVQREFQLEIRLWRYLRTLHSDSASETERDRAKRSVESWLDKERKAPSYDSPSWMPFLAKTWQSMTASIDAALDLGTEWLAELLDRYRPLPPPLLA